MGFSVEYSGLVITHVLYKAALVLTVVRWIWSWASRYLGLGVSDSIIDDEIHLQGTATASSPSSSSSSTSLISAQMIRDSLHVATYRDVAGRLPAGSGTCAVCLNDFRGRDKVWELRNCCHIFHKQCLNGWLDHDEHKTCPLCRAPLMGMGCGLDLDQPEPSWAVERFLYLFGDDLLSAPRT
ncbi:brassinosteroid-responsive RING protein 1-like [Aristolochia californica]|uniref:brassinosteroid-responsive RING protein 1-like n=1 Tax=Aristolochia californica TaxID=171875 RepID=UPI0035D8F578